MPRKLSAPGLIIVTLLLIAGLVSTATANHYQLSAQTLAGHAHLATQAAEQRWLQEREHLVLGISEHAYPPFDIISNGDEYEGLTADYADILGRRLGLPVVVRGFATRQEAEQALLEGRIDLLGSANAFELATPGIALSNPYAPDRPVLVTRKGERPVDAGDLHGLRMGMMEHYLPAASTEALYPGLDIIRFPTAQNALNAVAFGEVDAYLGDAISTQYLLERGHLPNVQMSHFFDHQPVGFGFAVRQDNALLLGLINSVVDAVDYGTRQRIEERWSAGAGFLLAENGLQWSHREAQWLADNPTVTVVVDTTFAPLTFLDHQQRLRGITADVLEAISLRTGLQFKIVQAGSVADMIETLEDEDASLIAAMAPSDSREQVLSFSRAYLLSPYVLVTADDGNAAQGMEHLAGQAVAITSGNPLIAQLRAEHPALTLVETDTSLQAMRLLAQGRVQGAVNPLISANHFIAAQGSERPLKIRTTLGTAPAAFSMALRRDAQELQGIIDKVLSSIGPQRLDLIQGRWRAYTPDVDASGQDYQRLIYQIVAGAAFLLLLSLSWSLYMRRQIRQRERAERALNDQFEFMRVLVNGTPHPIYVRDREGMLLSCNDCYLQTINVRREDVLGKSVLNDVIARHDEAWGFHEDYQRVMAEGRPLICDRPLHIGERKMTVYHWILPYHDSLGEVRGIIGGWIDISERLELLEALQSAKDQADAASRAKSTFLATMSHEIRTPMNAVIGMLELTLQRSDQRELDRPALEVAYQSAKDLLALIGDILDIARIESGRVSLSPEQVSLRQQVEAITRVFDGLARQKELSLSLNFASAADCDVLIDPLRFKQILSNLVSNAIKFTERGGVHITVEVLGCTDPAVVDLLVRVEDTGIGISDLDQQHLFQPFAQVGGHAQAGRSGTGLGLVISRGLCAVMGASLTLRSQPGAGTCVEMRLRPRRLDSAPVLAPSPKGDEGHRLPPLRVLIVDDHPANRLLVTQQLEFLGLQASQAANGAAALHLWLTEKFDVVVVDCNMPLMNGYELTRSIRQHERHLDCPPCSVLGYTANAQPEERERCLQAGMDDCLFKPLSLQALREKLCALQPLASAPQEVMDMRQLDPLTGGDRARQVRLLKELLDSCHADREALAALPAGTTHSAYRALAHRIKGAARMIRALPLQAACNTLEALEADDDPQPACDQVIAQLSALEQALIHELAVT